MFLLWDCVATMPAAWSAGDLIYVETINAWKIKKKASNKNGQNQH